MELKCPQIESARFTCDRDARYQIDGVVYCQIHARRLMELRLDAPYLTNNDYERHFVALAMAMEDNE